MELNAEQIIKALEWCTNADEVCEGCILFEDRDCTVHLLKKALALIKQLTEENESLKTQRRVLAINNKDAWRIVKSVRAENEDLKAIAEQYQKQFEDCANDRARLTEENERLMTECGNQSILWKQHFESIYETAKETVKADTVREMQERLKAYFGTYALGYKIPLSEALKAVNQIVKEMLEGV